MFTASMIEYQIDEEKKIITASVSGVEYDAIDTMKKAFRQNNLILEDTATYVEMIPDEDGKYCDENISLVDEFETALKEAIELNIPCLLVRSIVCPILSVLLLSMILMILIQILLSAVR